MMMSNHRPPALLRCCQRSRNSASGNGRRPSRSCWRRSGPGWWPGPRRTRRRGKMGRRNIRRGRRRHRRITTGPQPWCWAICWPSNGRTQRWTFVYFFYYNRYVMDYSTRRCCRGAFCQSCWGSKPETKYANLFNVLLSSFYLKFHNWQIFRHPPMQKFGSIS